MCVCGAGGGGRGSGLLMCVSMLVSICVTESRAGVFARAHMCACAHVCVGVCL